MEPKQYYIGIDVGGTSVKEGLFDEDGNLLAKASVPTPPIVDAAGFAAVTEAIDQVVAKAQIPRAFVAGIGLAVPCPIPASGDAKVKANIAINLPELRIAIQKHCPDAVVKYENDANAAAMVPNENTDLGEDDASRASAVQMNAAVPVVKEPAVIHDGIYDTGMHKVSIIAKLSKFDQLKTALNDLGVTGMTVTQVMGCGIQKGTTEKYRGVPVDSTLLPKIKVEVIVSKISVDAVVDAAKKALYTGHIGDGKIFVYNVTRVVKIRTGEEDFAALQDVE